MAKPGALGAESAAPPEIDRRLRASVPIEECRAVNRGRKPNSTSLGGFARICGSEIVDSINRGIYASIRLLLGPERCGMRSC